MRLPAPVFGAIQAAKYREIHSGLPFAMRVFMGMAALSSYFLVSILIAAISPVLGLIFSVVVNWLRSVPAWDVFVPLGYRLFAWLIRQGGE